MELVARNQGAARDPPGRCTPAMQTKPAHDLAWQAQHALVLKWRAAPTCRTQSRTLAPVRMWWMKVALQSERMTVGRPRAEAHCRRRAGWGRAQRRWRQRDRLRARQDPDTHPGAGRHMQAGCTRPALYRPQHATRPRTCSMRAVGSGTSRPISRRQATSRSRLTPRRCISPSTARGREGVSARVEAQAEEHGPPGHWGGAGGAGRAGTRPGRLAAARAGNAARRAQRDMQLRKA